MNLSRFALHQTPLKIPFLGLGVFEPKGEPNRSLRKRFDYESDRFGWRVDYEKLAEEQELKKLMKGLYQHVFEGTSEFDNGEFESLDSIIDSETGLPADLFVDTGGGGDTVVTGDGNDVVYVGGYADSIGAKVVTQGGHDLVFGSNGDDIVIAGSGNDHVNAGSGNDCINLGDGWDSCSGGSGNDFISGGGGDDFLTGDSGQDKVFGGLGEDHLDGESVGSLISTDSDLLAGGGDADSFQIYLDGKTDWILDFNDIGDKICLRANPLSGPLGFDDWFLQESAYVAPELAQALTSYESPIKCFNIINSETGQIAASVTKGFEDSLLSGPVHVKLNADSIEIVSQDLATMTLF